MSSLDSFTGLIESVVLRMMAYSVPRIGKVLSVDDSLNKGRVEVAIPALNWNDSSTSVWAWASDKKSMIVPEKDSYVLVEWIDRNPDLPIYRGVPANLKDQIVSSYDGDPKNNILFEGADGAIITALDGDIIVNEGEKGAARVDDPTISSSSEDSSFWAFFSAFFGVITGATIPEPGNGSASALQAALALAITAAGGTPSEMAGKIKEGSETVKVGD